MTGNHEILLGDCLTVLRTLPDQRFHCCVTSPPYWGLRDYGVGGQLGLEPTPEEYVAKMVAVFREVRRVLCDDGTLWLNLGDTYCGNGPGSMAGSTLQGSREHQAESRKVRRGGDCDPKRGAAAPGQPMRSNAPGFKPKDLMGIPWRVAFALQADGWYLRSAIVWAKPNAMPGSQEDRPTSSYELVFLLSKSATYYSNFDAIKTPPRESSMVRLAQDIQAQAGSSRANGGAKTNGAMKAVGIDKQRGHSRRHDGFNDRWDQMEKGQPQAAPAMMRDVWFIATASFDDAHFAVMPEEVARRCILAGSPEGGHVLDPFNGSGTTGVVACRLGRDYTGIELNPAYIDMSRRRISAALRPNTARNDRATDSPLFSAADQG